MKALGNFLFITLFFTVYACSPKPIHIDEKTINNVLKDFNMVPAPNTLDKVGTIFAIDKNKKQLPITDLDITPKEGDAELRNYQEARTTTWGVLIDFLGLQKLNLTANAGVDNKTMVSTKISFDGATLSRANLLEIDQKLSEKIEEIKKYIKKNKIENYKFYLIIEVVKTKKLNYQFDRSVVGK